MLVAIMAAPMMLVSPAQPIPAVAAGDLERTIAIIAAKTGASIGLRDATLARVRTLPVRTVGDTKTMLRQALSGTGLAIRQVAPSAFLIVRNDGVRPHRRPALSEHASHSPGDIVVIGSRRATRLRDYAGSVQRIDGAAAAIRGREGSDALVSTAVSLSSTYLGQGRQKLFIRGIADSSLSGLSQPTAGLYWNDARMTFNMPDPSIRLYDLRSVEILEGPQGTTYGSGAMGGIIHFQPAAPDSGTWFAQIWGSAAATGHGAPSLEGGLVANIPFNERIAFRGVGYVLRDGGYIDAPLRGRRDVNRVSTHGGRVAVRIVPDQNWRIDLGVLGQRIGAADSQYSDPSTGRLAKASLRAEPFRSDYGLGTIAASRAFGSASFSATAGYAQQTLDEWYESSPTLDYRARDRTKLASLDMHVFRRRDDGSGWSIGASVLRNVALVVRETSAGGMSARETILHQSSDEGALFGEVGVAVTPALLVSAGARATVSRSAGESVTVRPERGDGSASVDRVEARILPSLSVIAWPSRPVSLYARYERGFRPGGISPTVDFSRRYAADRLDTAEIGLRAGSLDADSYHVSASLALSRWTNIQADILDGAGFPILTNIGNGTVRVLGVTAEWRPLSGLSVSAAAAWNHSRLRATVGVPLVNIGCETAEEDCEQPRSFLSHLPNLPALSGRLGLAYATVIRGDEVLSVSGYGRYTGRSYLGSSEQLWKRQGRYLESGLDIRLGNIRRSATLSLTNLFDTRRDRFALGNPFRLGLTEQATPPRPRTLRIGFDRQF